MLSQAWTTVAPASAAGATAATSMATVIRRTVRAVGYLVSGLVAGVIGLFWTIVATVAVSVLAVTQLGGPAFLGAAWVTRRLAAVERARAGWVLRQPIGSPYDDVDAATMAGRVRAVGAQPATWRDLAWLLVGFPLGLAGGIAAIVTSAVTLGMITAPAWTWAVPNPHAPWLIKPAMTTTPGHIVLTLIGLALLPLVGRLLPALARFEAQVARALLAPGEHRRLLDRAARLAESRARVVDAQAAELRRIERDLHDGAQARIVAAGMTLALAERKHRTGADVSDDMSLARRQLDDALAELRRLVRGIHPPILTDRGLYQALSALAADSPLDVQVDGDQTERFAPAVESAAYFVAAEGLTNAGKHADATRATITLRRSAGVISVRLTDDGRGGADPTGAGLDGLRRRIEALDGTLTVTSPTGGPTALHAEFPCAS